VRAFRGAVEDFGPKTLSPTEIWALYGFRCALVYAYGFINNVAGTDKHRVFAKTEERVPWRHRRVACHL
jgi:hypothetical protein